MQHRLVVSTLWWQLSRPRLASLVLRVALPAVGGALGILALGQVLWMAIRLLYPGEAAYGEATIYDHAARLLQGQALYQPLGQAPYTIVPYTPLYYWLVAVLRATAGPGFGPGRIVSALATGLVAVLVGYLAVTRARDIRAGAFASLMFVALGLSTSRPWSVLFKEDALGIGLSVASITMLLVRSGRGGILASAALAGLAILTKQLFFSAALAGFIWLWFTHGRRNALMFAGTVAAIVLVPCVITAQTTPAFLANTVGANFDQSPLSWAALQANLELLSKYEVAPLVIAAIYVVNAARQRSFIFGDLLIMYWLISLLSLIGLAKVGSNYNYWIECSAITAVLAAAAIWSYRDARLGATAWKAATSLGLLGLLVVQLGVLAPNVDLSVFSQFRYRVRTRQGAVDEFSRLVERVRSEPGEVLANPMDVVVLANRPILLEPVVFSVLSSESKWNPGPLVQRICAHQVTLFVTNNPLEQPDDEFQGLTLWPAAVHAALREVMAFDQQQAGRYVYVARHSCAAGVG